MGFRDFVRREFALSNMLARASRRDAVEEAKLELDMWADYGDAALLDRIVARLRSVGSRP